MSVYPDSSYRAAAASCSVLLNNPKFKQYITWMRRDRDSSTTLSMQEKREFLAKVIRTPIGEVEVDSMLAQEVTLSPDGSMKIKMPSKTDALKIDNAMMGHDAPKKIDVEHKYTVGDLIRDIAGRDTSLIPSKQEIEDLDNMKKAEKDE